MPRRAKHKHHSRHHTHAVNPLNPEQILQKKVQAERLRVRAAELAAEHIAPPAQTEVTA